MGELEDDIQKLKTDRKTQEQKLRDKDHQTELERCTAFLKGLIDSGEIGTDEMQKAAQIMNQFSDEENLQVLKMIGTTKEAFENMKNFDDTQAHDMETECEICFEPGRRYMFVPCGHV